MSEMPSALRGQGKGFLIGGPYRKSRATGLGSPLPELLEDHPVGEALAADPNALKNPVAAQLVQHQMGIQFASLRKSTCVWSCFCA